MNSAQRGQERSPLAGDLAEFHFKDLRRLRPSDLILDRSDTELLGFAEAVLNPAIVPDFRQAPDIRLGSYAIEHFRASCYQLAPSNNPMRMFEGNFYRKLKDVDVEAVSLADALWLIEDAPSRHPSVGDARAYHYESLVYGLKKHSEKVPVYQKNLDDEGSPSLAFFIHSELVVGDSGYRWWRDSQVLRHFAKAPVDYIIWLAHDVSRPEPVAHYTSMAAFYSVKSLKKRWTSR